jgi:hypothetical protein
MFKYLKVGSILIAVVFVLSFSTAQACPMIPGKSCCNEPCKDEACEYKKSKLMKVSTAESADTEEVVLNIRGMTCSGCENKVKGALIE